MCVLFFFKPLIILVVLTSHLEWCVLKPGGSSYFTGSYGKSVLQLPYRSQNIILSVNKPLNTHLWTLQLKLKNKTLHNLFLSNKLHSWYFTVVSSNQNTKQVIKTKYWVSTSAVLFISFLMCMPRIPEVHVIMQVMLIIICLLNPRTESVVTPWRIWSVGTGMGIKDSLI